MPEPRSPPPQCLEPCSFAFCGETAPSSCASAPSRTAETSMAMPSSAAGDRSQPRPTKSHFAAVDEGRSTTAPCSMVASDTHALCLFGKFGRSSRISLPMTGSSMSMKCRPLAFTKSPALKALQEASPVRLSAMMVPASPVGSSTRKRATSESLPSSSTLTTALAWSFRWPPETATTMTTISCTCGGMRWSENQTATPQPSLPTCGPPPL
mmetsp:Transcript_44712/g.127607  ORF Transcript_44712/g.127607 Transcript_44712/m.127607 type:complete len:210 (-) Transcript_44712:1985-2614(-)